jgi:NAD(P)-dependent dehydrogenase (short-subunit alcohol dehydrogenase family)
MATRAMDALLKDVKARYGRLDVVVANAVVDAHAPLAKITEEQFDTMIGTNLKAVLFAVQSAVPLMSSGGSIILIGSTASVAPPAGMSIYGAIKAGFHGMVRALIQDLQGTGVRINIHHLQVADSKRLKSPTHFIDRTAGCWRSHLCSGLLNRCLPCALIATQRFAAGGPNAEGADEPRLPAPKSSLVPTSKMPIAIARRLSPAGSSLYFLSAASRLPSTPSWASMMVPA